MGSDPALWESWIHASHRSDRKPGNLNYNIYPCIIYDFVFAKWWKRVGGASVRDVCLALVRPDMRSYPLRVYAEGRRKKLIHQFKLSWIISTAISDLYDSKNNLVLQWYSTTDYIVSGDLRYRSVSKYQADLNHGKVKFHFNWGLYLRDNQFRYRFSTLLIFRKSNNKRCCL